MTTGQQSRPKRRTRGNPFGQNDTKPYDVVETIKMDSQSPEGKLLSAAVQAGLSKSDLIRRCVERALPDVIEQVQSELGKLVKLS